MKYTSAFDKTLPWKWRWGYEIRFWEIWKLAWICGSGLLFFFFFFNAVLFLEAIKTLLRNPSHSRIQARTASWFKLPIGNRDFSADDTSTHKISGSLFWPEVTPDWDSSWEKNLWGLAHRNIWGRLTFSKGFCGFTLSGVSPELCSSTVQIYSSKVVL